MYKIENECVPINNSHKDNVCDMNCEERIRQQL